MIKKILQTVFKKFFYTFFSKLYGKIETSITCEEDNRAKVKKVKIDNNLDYKIYKIQDSRLYTDRIQDTAIIVDNKIVDGPSFQFRHLKDSTWFIQDSKVNENIVYRKGTPRFLKKINGNVLSLLTGGAGNNNYWHWLFDVLPRIGIFEKVFNLEDVDYFLVPDNARKFQNETLSCLQISMKKVLSSKKFRHIKAPEIIVTDHPVLTTGNATNDILNIPIWISKWLREKFISEKIKNNKDVKNKIYIERDTALSKKVPERSISNEGEVKNYLKNCGFISVKLGEVSFNEQVNLFYNADYIIGLHGAAFANLVFCKPGTKVLEFKSNTAGKAILNLAKNNNLNYNSIATEVKHVYEYNFPTQQGHIKIPMNELKKIFNSN